MMAICSRCRVSSRDSTALIMNAATLRNTTGKPMEIVCQHADFVRDPDVRGVIGAPVGAPPAVGRQQTVQLGDDGTLRRARREREREVVECAVEVEGGGQLLVGHPEDAVGAVVRQRGAGARFEDELGREHDAGDAEVSGAGR